MGEPKIIGGGVYVALNNKGSASLRTYTCKLEGECPLLAKGQCIQTGFLSTCVYGSCSQKTSHTQRARSYYGEKKKFEEQAAQMPPVPEYPVNAGIHLIGDYYYIPYAHVTMCEAVAFKSHSCLIMSGVPFVPKDKFGPEQVVTLTKFRPQALIGGEITQYRKEEVPQFLFHLKMRFPEMYKAAVALYPEIANKTFSLQTISSLKCKLFHIPVGRTEGYKIVGAHDKLVDVMAYDSGTMVVKGQYEDMFLSWGGLESLKGSVAKIEFVPDPHKLQVVVTDKLLINQIILADPSLVTSKG